MNSFDFDLATRIVCGPGTIEQTGNLVRHFGGTHVLVVSDKGIQQAGHVDKLLQILNAVNLKTTLFIEVRENPTSEDVEKGTALAKENDIDFIVGIGGGSSMDCSKGINFLFSNGGKMADYWGVNKATQPMLPGIGLPTTTGTGSEAQCFALISDSVTHNKMACGDKKAAFRAAILDPTLTLSQPRNVAIATGIDAISHALETAVTNKRNAISQMFSFRAWQLLIKNFSASLQRPDDLEVRAQMQIGACYAGIAIENSMLGAAHSCANPLTKHFGIVHGIAVLLMLPAIVRYNYSVVGDTYSELCHLANWSKSSHSGETIVAKLQEIAELCAIKTRLSQYGIAQEQLPVLAQEAAKQWTAQFNPRSLSEQEFLEIYESVW